MSPCRSQRGSISVCVLVCLIIITALSGALLRVGLAERNRLSGEERRLQAEWLAESGIERAVARLASSRGKYDGETWDLSGVELGGLFPGRVAITIEPVGSHADQRRVLVRADYPREATLRARISRTTVVDLDGTTAEKTP